MRCTACGCPRGSGGEERGSKLKDLTFKAGGSRYRLAHSVSDSQVWEVRGQDARRCGLVLVYTDDVLLLTQKGACREGLNQALRDTWKIGAESELTVGKTLSFIGLELQRERAGSLYIHQRTFC